MKKQMISMILCLILLLTLFVTPAYAAPADVNVNVNVPPLPEDVHGATASGYPFSASVPADLVLLDDLSGDSPDGAADRVPTEAEAFAIMTALKPQFPEGMPYTNDDYYQWNGGIFRGGYGCAGFCFYLSDAVFGYAPAYIVREFTYEQIRVGDILRINNNTHSVTIMEKYDDRVVLAEANYGGTVHWGRTFTRSEVMLKGTYLMSRYPKAGWYRENGNWYFYVNGEPATGWIGGGSSWYYLDSNGIMQTGWVKVNGSWYYMNANGVMQTGWIKVNGSWYFLNASGVMQTGWVGGTGSWYYLNASGVMQTGWVKIGGAWYYMNSNGVMQTGWLRLGNCWYYLFSNGVMATGTHVIDGKTCTFDSSGILIS